VKSYKYLVRFDKSTKLTLVFDLHTLQSRLHKGIPGKLICLILMQAFRFNPARGCSLADTENEKRMGASRRKFLKSLGSLAAATTVGESWGALNFGTDPTSPAESGQESSSASNGMLNKVPLIHCTDLFQPPNDPDDHVDLATVFAIPQFNVRAIILDQGQLQAATPGNIPVEQMEALTGRKIPFATGLGTPLRYPEDKGLNQFPNYQGAVELILRILRESNEKVFFTIVGSARDVVAAYNREPELFRQKTARIYFADGNNGGGDFQWNPLVDPQAYFRLMTAALPLYWCPAFGKSDTVEDMAMGKLKPDVYRVYWKFRQSEVFAALPSSLQNYFLYALSRKDPALTEPIAYLHRTPETKLREQQWKETRYMWSTAAIYDAAGCDLYRKGESWLASSNPVPGFEKALVYEFAPANVSIDRDLRITLDFTGSTKQIKVFHVLDTTNYELAMQVSLRRLLSDISLAEQFGDTH
jgi:hypothetical protein